MSTIKIGDTVAWADVPDGAMVRAGGDHVVRLRGRGVYVSEPGEPWLDANPWSDEGKWLWSSPRDQAERVTIIALGLTGSESAEDLQRMAEIFDGWRDLCERTGWDREMAWGNAVALHGFGWRAGLPFVADLARAASDPCAACAEMDGWGCREHQSAAVAPAAPAAPGSTGGLEP